MKKAFKIIAVSLIILVFLAWFGGRMILSLSTADYAGELQIAGIEQTVEITFDEKGIPQIWAESDDDIFFTLGWLHASERLFQMELLRRVVSGELSEIFGAGAYSLDVRQRQIGFARQVREDKVLLDQESRHLLQKYCSGINSWIHYKNILPPEFVILGFSPHDWQVEDCLSIILYQTWYAHSLMDKDRSYDKLAGNLGEEVIKILQSAKTWSPPTIHDSFLKNIFSRQAFPMRMSQASNSWVVSPQKSASGAAIHASDPHLVINRVPGFWYIAGLHSQGGTDVLGVTAPGLPMVMMGHNRDIAYAFTVASVDLIDYYHFDRHPRDSLQILTDQGYQPLGIISEEISVKGEENPRRLQIFTTPRGPVIESDSAGVIAIKWAGFDFNISDVIRSAMNLHHLENFTDFRQTVSGFGALDVNWTYSDKNGNTGYQLGAPIPKRDYSNTYALLDGGNPATGWKGYYPLEQTPYLLNPEEGWLATCNNRIVSDQWPYPIPGFYDPYRITRAAALLSGKTKFNKDELGMMQMEIISGHARRWKGLMADGASQLNLPDLAADIRAWNGSFAVDAELPALFSLWWEFLAKTIFEDDLGKEWYNGLVIQEEVLSNNLSPVINNHNSGDTVETAADISAEALQYVRETFGMKKYGDISTLTVVHPLSNAPVAGGLLDFWLDLNRGPFPAPGDHGSLNANFKFWLPEQQKFISVAGPSMRFILDWSDVDGFTINTNLGQSGNPLSPHYDDQFEIMRRGQRWNVPFSKDKVYAKKKSLLRLIPEGI